MTKVEVSKVLRFLNNYYNNRFEYPKSTKEATNELKETWYMFLSEYEYEIAKVALKRVVINKEWPPTPGEITQEIERLTAPEGDKLTAGEAWQLVIKVIRKYGTAYGVKKAEAELPRKVLKTANQVGGLRNIGMSDENDSYYMNHFCKIYESVSQAIDMDERLPQGIRQDTEKIAKSLRLEGGK